MTILKAVSVETEAWKVGFREQQKERMEEVMAIRRAIIELFDSKPGQEFSNKEILEWLVGKGFNIKLRQIAPKMKMMVNVFKESKTEEIVQTKTHKTWGRVWHRIVCDICKKPFELEDDLWISGKLERHGACNESVTELLKPVQNKNCELNGQVNILLQEKGELLADNAELKEEVNRLNSMIVFPSQNDSKGTRKIILD